MSRLCIVGGTTRNVGKTTFCCQLIAKLAKHIPIYGLKVSTIFPDETLQHGDHSNISEHLFEETRKDTTKDTSRMLRAGASRVFYLQGDDNHIAQGYQDFLDHIPPKSFIVCESNSLGHILLPDLMIMLVQPANPIKSRAATLLNRADLIISPKDHFNFPEVSKITITKTSFRLRQDPLIQTN